MRRTEKEPLVTDHLTGIREAGSEPNEVIDEIHGLYDDPATSLSRVPGKVMATTGTGLGPIWSLHQLRFRDRYLLLSHNGPQLNVQDMAVPIPGVRFPLPVSNPATLYNDELLTDNPHWPNPPFPDLPDIPFDSPDWPVYEALDEVREEPDGTLPYGYRFGSDYHYIYVTPPSLQFDADSDWAFDLADENFDLTKSDWPERLGCYVEATWDASWLTLTLTGALSNVQYGSGDIIPVSAWAEAFVYELRALVDKDGLLGGTYTTTVLLSAVDFVHHYEYLLNPDGQRITTELQITMVIGGARVEIVTSSPLVYTFYV